MKLSEVFLVFLNLTMSKKIREENELTIKDLLNEPISDGNPKCQHNIDEALRDIEGVPFLAILFSVLEIDK